MFKNEIIRPPQSNPEKNVRRSTDLLPISSKKTRKEVSSEQNQLASPPTESAYRTQSEYPSSSTNTPVNDIQSSYESKSSSQKMAVFKEAQAKANLQIDQITEQVAVLAAEDAQRRLQSTTQTVIPTQSVASGETHAQEAHLATTSTTTSSSSESHRSSSHQ